eukprot:sb/3465221/
MFSCSISDVVSGTVVIVAGEMMINGGRVVLEGRSVEPAPNCAVDMCQNGGTCVEATGVCEGCDAGYTGDTCTELVSCTKGCLNGGQCLGNNFCHCELGFQGPLYCVSRAPPSKQIYIIFTNINKLYLGRYTCFIATLTGNESFTNIYKLFKYKGGLEHNNHQDDSVLTVEVNFAAMQLNGNDGSLMMMSAPLNEMKITSTGGQIYISFMRGESQAVFAGPATAFLGTVKIVADKTSVTITNNGEAVLTHDLAGSALPQYERVTVSGYIFSDVTISVSGSTDTSSDALIPTSGNRVIVGTTDIVACVDGVTARFGASVSCSGCPTSTNPLTCGVSTCDPEMCHGTCTDVGDCVCDSDRYGENCEYAQDISQSTVLKTVSPYTSHIAVSKVFPANTDMRISNYPIIQLTK